MEDRPGRTRPDVAQIFRSRPDERALDNRVRIASAAVAIAPLLVVAAAVSVFIPLGQLEILVAVGFLALAPAVLSLAWLPGGSPARARSSAAITATLVGAAVGWLGFQANPCVAEPAGVGLVAVLMAVGTFLVALAIGRKLAIDRHVVAALLTTGIVAFLGFLATAFTILPMVFVLC